MDQARHGDVSPSFAKEWLRYSTNNIKENVFLEEACHNFGLRQLIKEPTREDNLLDLVLTNTEAATCSVQPKVADHKLLEVCLHLPVPRQEAVTRVVWDFRKAKWQELKQGLQNVDWDFLESCSPDEGAQALIDKVFNLMQACIPRRTFIEKKSSHPWLNDKVEKLVQKRQDAEGTSKEREEAESCSKGILEEYHKHLTRVRSELSTLKPGSKKWWSKIQELVQEKGKTCNIPAFKKKDQSWVTTAAEKANLLADNFSAKYCLDEAQTNCYTLLTQQQQTVEEWS